MMRAIIPATVMTGAAIVALAGCGPSKTVTAQNASTAEVAQKVKESGLADGGFVSPGRWRMTTTVTAMTIPGLPPEIAKRMQENTGKQHSFEHCVTKEDAKKPKEDFFAGKAAKSCRYDSFTLGGGKVDMVMHCAGPTGGKQVMKMTGAYSADAYHMTMASEMTGDADGKAGSPMKGMTMNATIDAKRLGVCTGKEAE